MQKNEPDEEYLRRVLAICHGLLEIDTENKRTAGEILIVEELLGKCP